MSRSLATTLCGLIAIAACAAVALLWWGGDELPTTGGRGNRSAGQGDALDPDGELPPEVAAALRGEPVEAPAEGALPFDVEIAALEGRPDALPGGAPRGPSGPEAGAEPVAGAGDEGAGEDGVTPQERERRAGWIDRQNRRDALRIEVLQDSLGVAPLLASQAREAFRTALNEKVELYETRPDDPPAVLGPLLAEIRRRLAENLTAILGEATFDAYTALDDAGHFVLDDEVKKPE